MEMHKSHLLILSRVDHIWIWNCRFLLTPDSLRYGIARSLCESCIGSPASALTQLTRHARLCCGPQANRAPSVSTSTLLFHHIFMYLVTNPCQLSSTHFGLRILRTFRKSSRLFTFQGIRISMILSIHFA